MEIIDNDDALVLRAIESANGGRLTPEAVIEAAEAAEHPWHDRFEWDDAKAGHQHRVEQARRLIRGVRVLVRTDTTTVSTVYYVRDPSASPSEQGYVSLPRLRSDKELAHEAITGEFARAASALERAKSLSAALDLMAEVDGLLGEVQRVRSIADDRVAA